jgi:endonuclease YncB( thermonuclease family)
LSALLFACTVAWVIDGDTFNCSDRRKVRLAGIDAPGISRVPAGAAMYTWQRQAIASQPHSTGEGSHIAL